MMPVFLHRDIKPSNIYLRSDDSPVLIDFGSSRQTELLNTSDATVLVSQGYTPLEQYSNGFGEQGPWTDIYSLAASVYYAVSGKVVVDALHRNATLQMGKPDPVGSFSTITGGLSFSKEFVSAIDHALKLKPQERPQTLSLWRDMFEARDDETVLMTPATLDDETVLITPASAAAGQALQDDSIGDAVTLVQGADEPWSPSSNDNGSDKAPVVKAAPAVKAAPVVEAGDNPSKKNSGLPKSLYLAGLVLVLGAGGYLWMQKAPEQSDTVPEVASFSIEGLPRPAQPIEVESPVDLVKREIQVMDRQLALYTEAKEIDGSSPDALAGIAAVAERYELLAMSPTVRNSKSLSTAVSEGIVKSVGVNVDNQGLIAKLVTGNPNASLDKLQKLMGQSSLSSDEQADLLYGLAGLSSEDRGLLSSEPAFAALTENFRAAIIAQVQAGDFNLAAIMTELALMVQPADQQLNQLQLQLSGEK